MSNALADYIAEKNAKTAAWVAEAPGRWACGLCDDTAHWAAQGVNTPEELEKYLLVCDVYESTKSAYGYKPSWAGLMTLTLEELAAQSAHLGRATREEIEREEQDKRDRIARKAAESQRAALIRKRAFTHKPFKLDTAFALAGL